MLIIRKRTVVPPSSKGILSGDKMPKIFPRYAKDITEIGQKKHAKKIGAKCLGAKCPLFLRKLGQNVLGQNVLGAKRQWGKMSLGQNVLGAKCPLA